MAHQPVQYLGERDGAGIPGRGLGVLIEVLNGVNVAVERALYWKSGGVAFAGGTNATAVQVP